MKANKKSSSSSDIKKNFIGVDFEKKFSKMKKGKPSFEHLFTNESERNFVTVRDHSIKHIIVSEVQKQDRMIGVHRKMKSNQIKDMQEYEMNLMKFRRTPSPEKRMVRQATISPSKPEFVSNEDHLFALSLKFGRNDNESLKIESRNRKKYNNLKKIGFVDRKGIANVKFITRYEQIVGAIYPLKHSITSVLQSNNRIRLKHK